MAALCAAELSGRSYPDGSARLILPEHGAALCMTPGIHATVLLVQPSFSSLLLSYSSTILRLAEVAV